MVVCPACLATSAEGARFCSSCGAPLMAPAPAAPHGRVEERKIVSVLFCDLVGFTAHSEQADPEDVARLLDGYASMARAAITAHGGVVEKFIGDAVVGVFGVPATHEDDALRAVRAGLSICSSASDRELRLRVGINTGEALVRLDVTPEAGERFMTGDAVNTAARIQSVAPELGVAIGEATWRATRHAIHTVELPPATLKGKAEPVRVFHAVGARSLEAAAGHGGGFIGRAAELGWLVAAFERAIVERRTGLVVVTGEPGIGKSRIVDQLRRHVAAVEPAVTWREGRCLPYGDGITFWALGEVVKSHAGILEGDDPGEATAKLDAALAGVADRDWLRARLLPLAGVAVDGSPPSRVEAFAAWRAFLAAVAGASGAVVVLEDLHWADDALLEFVAEVASSRDDAPLLLLATARPELFAREGVPGAIRDAERVDLAPMQDDEAAELVTDLLGGMLPRELQAAILERSEGNPLFAEEYVRLLTDRGLLVETHGSIALATGAALPVPESIGALLAARLDTLPRERKAILADGSVVGQVFWAGTVAAMADRDRGTVRDALAELARLEFVRPVTPSSMADEEEAAFWHALGRDVAYAQLPRAERAQRHIAAARWLEAKAGDRVGDIAELLAHHYATALELAEATGDQSLADAIRPNTARLLRLSGERNLGLDTTAALHAFERALALMTDDDPDRALATFRLGAALFQAAQYDRAIAAFRAALEGFEAADDHHQAAMVKIELSRAIQYVGPPQWGHQLEALETLEAEGASADLVYALGSVAFVHLVSDRPGEAIACAERAIDLATALGLPEPAAPYAWRGTTRCMTGDPRGLDDGRRAIELATAAGQSRDAAIFRNEYAANVAVFVGSRAAEVAARDLEAFAASRGLSALERMGRDGVAYALVEQGRFDEAGTLLDEAVAHYVAAGDRVMHPVARMVLMQLALIQGDLVSALETATLLEDDPLLDDLTSAAEMLASAARVRAQANDRDGAARLLARLDRLDTAPVYRGIELRDAVIAALGIGDLELARRWIATSDDRRPYIVGTRQLARALLLEAEGRIDEAVPEFEAAATTLEPLSTPHHTHALLGLGRSLVAIGRWRGAVAPLTQARRQAVAMGAAPWTAEADALLSGIETPAGGAPAGV